MAVDPREFDALSPADGAAVRAKLGLGADRLLVAPSRLAAQKGADLLLEAVAPLLQGGAGGWRLVVAGAVNEPDFAARVDALARPLGDRVVRTELPRAELCALLLEADIVCLPSRGETVGGVVFEGMYAGALCIVSDAVEAAREEYLRDGVNGLLVPALDVGALRAALQRAMTTDTSAMRREGRAMVDARYTWPRSVERLWTVYEEAVERAARRRGR
jgi:glycosyltransferase involved in cell wall biosynthesis